MINSLSPGYDGVMITQIYDGLPILSQVLADLFNRIIGKGIFLECWKKCYRQANPQMQRTTYGQGLEANLTSANCLQGI